MSVPAQRADEDFNKCITSSIRVSHPAIFLGHCEVKSVGCRQKCSEGILRESLTEIPVAVCDQ